MGKIRLDKFSYVVIDDEDEERCRPFRWRLRIYRRRAHVFTIVELNGKKGFMLHLHRFIMNCPDDKYVTFKRQNGLDCRKSNLRMGRVSDRYREVVEYFENLNVRV